VEKNYVAVTLGICLPWLAQSRPCGARSVTHRNPGEDRHDWSFVVPNKPGRQGQLIGIRIKVHESILQQAQC
jgi:hypothetical protein